MYKAKIEALKQKNEYTIDDLVEIMEILRSPNGCPWDREQTHKTIRRNLIEETYEVVEAIDKDDKTLMCEELGDLLLQVVFHARMAEEDGDFTFSDVADGICKKLILRHPHIFSDVKADTTEQVLTNWDNIKKEEKHQKSNREVLDSVSHSLPSLIRADKLAGKCHKLGYDIATDDIAALANEFLSQNNAAVSEKTLGKLLLGLSAAARERGIDAEKALADACDDLISATND